MIDTAALGFALGAGLVAALNPCGFAFLPGYLGLVIAGTSHLTSRPAALARAGAATVAMSAGFLTVFGIFGLLISPLIASAQKYLPFATVVIGVVLVALAVWLLAGRDVSVILPKLSGARPTARLRSMYGYGVGYAVASLSCTIAPFLAVISTTFKQGSALSGVLAFLAYAAGMTITVGVAALAVAFAGSSAASMIRGILPYINRIAGAVVLLTGLYVIYYGYYEIRLFFLNSGPNDPIIQAAAAVQGWLVQQVDTLGAWPLLGALVVLAAAAVGWRVVAPRRRRSRDADLATTHVAASQFDVSQDGGPADRDT
jgi:cytochrome c biogenesis protein CcdA